MLLFAKCLIKNVNKYIFFNQHIIQYKIEVPKTDFYRNCVYCIRT